MSAPPVPLWRRLVISAQRGIPRAWASLGSLALFDWRVADVTSLPFRPDSAHDNIRSRGCSRREAAASWMVAPATGATDLRQKETPRIVAETAGLPLTRRLPRAAACEVCISTRRVKVQSTARALSRGSTRRTPPAGVPTAALSLARERFAEKRASGSRPRRVVRCSCLRPRGIVTRAATGRALRHEYDRQLDCLAHDFLGDSSIAGARAARPGARLMAVLAPPGAVPATSIGSATGINLDWAPKGLVRPSSVVGATGRAPIRRSSGPHQARPCGAVGRRRSKACRGCARLA